MIASTTKKLIADISTRLSLKQIKPPFNFHGGLALEPNKRALKSDLFELPVPPTLVLPLINYAKQPLTPIVDAGQSVLRGQLLAQGLVAPTSGLIRAIEIHKTIHPDSLKVNSIILDSDGEDQRVRTQHQSYETRLEALTNAFTIDINTVSDGDDEDAISILNQYALLGLGGAGFPTATKLLAAKKGLHTLIINAAECEPEIACDEALMQSDASSIAKGISALTKLTRCQVCIVAIEDSKPEAIECMRKALIGIDSSIEVMTIPTRYPTGAESPLIECVTGQFIPHDERPVDHGVVCINIATAHALWQALNNRPLDSRIISLGGKSMPHPCNVLVRFGTPIDFIIRNTNNAGAINTSRIRAGGPLSGFDLTTLSVPATAKTNCILAEPKDSDIPASACIRCGQCSDVCPAKLLPQQLHWYAMADDLNKCSQLNLEACIECGCCDLVCPASIKLTETFRYAKSQVAEATLQQQKASDAELRYEAREHRELQRKQAKAAAIEQRKQSIKATTQPSTTQIAEALARARANRKPKDT